jgi:hypothetical protein
MQDAVNSLMLVCAALASLAFGVLAAYGLCRVAFAKLFRHAGPIAAPVGQPPMPAQVSQPDTL